MNAERAAWERATEQYLAQLQPYWDAQLAAAEAKLAAEQAALDNTPSSE